MKIIINILIFITLNPMLAFSKKSSKELFINFYGDTVVIPLNTTKPVYYITSLSSESIKTFYDEMENSEYIPVVNALLDYKYKYNPDDWMYYQLIRRVAQHFSPKNENYHRYTLYKWYFLIKSGYDAIFSISDKKILFYVQCDEEIYDIPYRMRNGKQYICLNYHDYGSNIDFNKDVFYEVVFDFPAATRSFSYKLTQLPNFSPDTYEDKDIEFNYKNITYKFRVKLNPEIKTLFANYPVADYQLYFNAPLSHETYNTLIPQLKDNMKKMSTEKGVDYLMRFTRYAFIYRADADNFGKEKRLSPEQTLLYSHSDCEDRAALFYYLVKEIYNLPMIVLAYPNHVTIAVKFDKPVGKTIKYNGEEYSICEPTPQKRDLPIGAISSELRKESYQVAFSYDPDNN